MKIKKVVISIGLIIFSLFTFVLPVFSASSYFLPQATKFYENYCSKKRIPVTIAISCYLYDKTGELQIELDNLNSRVGNLESQDNQQTNEINELKQRIEALEATPTPSPLPTTTPIPTSSPCPPAGCEMTFMNWQIPKSGAVSNISDARLYSNLDIAYYCAIEAELRLEYSDDQTNWTAQITATPAQCKSPGGNANAIPVLGDYYRVVVGPITITPGPEDYPYQFIFAQARYH